MYPKVKSITNPLLLLLTLVLGIFAGVLLGELYDPNNIILGRNVTPTEIRAGGHKFISPLLECEMSEVSSQINGLDPLHDSIEKYVEDKKDEGILAEAGVYFRDLNNGPWFGINERANFSPASLLKLPVMMAYFKEAENNPQLLTAKAKPSPQLPILQQDLSSPSVKEDIEYTVEELIERMIQNSDNAALVILENLIDNKKIDKITQDLGVETANVNSPQDFMSVKGYASLFRILYNASYLTKDYSEKSLAILSKTQFKEGIVAGVPKNVTVAHKYGERQLADGILQLHDCGIVYYPQHPYLLCIMSRGTSYDNLATIIKDVSEIVYTELDSKHKSKK